MICFHKTVNACTQLAHELDELDIGDIALPLYLGSMILHLQKDEMTDFEFTNLPYIAMCSEPAADLFLNRGEYDKAIPLYLKCRDAWEMHYQKTGNKGCLWNKALAIFYYAGCLEQMDNYKDAEVQFKEAYDLATILVDSVEEARQNKKTFEKSYKRCMAMNWNDHES